MSPEIKPSCPECGDPVVPVPPVNWITPGPTPAWTHRSDGTALCPVVTPAGYRPAEPVTHLNSPDLVLIIRGREATR
ncbi:hypothetical protein GCM10010472_03100 [Pseudonocardia halophobica]|uniref:Uncharacterized protein n=1 Tax=Pseudonocardia halophobica TaxID=29401 RepID=A0A9W6L0P7_9PSEU|nr:hypothetical protein GCM10017577_17900 [Pseudonocardia halophobica]